MYQLHYYIKCLMWCKGGTTNGLRLQILAIFYYTKCFIFFPVIVINTSHYTIISNAYNNNYNYCIHISYI